ncbi:oligosaccharide flippase family protein [Rhodococcus sp. IEGM 1408]|uniref:oligosaccharide flippase family protein n=1 Tax=Rhodococcus sp. IEGM 1408 TaxID=3082220 RepID=UPI002955CF24|nr:oligosaccharide flippase family protein [Rhodococcus sp. IEGM 1408]MDV7999970.1 oligosaccharide flippase family protein [Rhodococcus sp. IEGM 1408]
MQDGPSIATPDTGRQSAWNYIVFTLSKSSALIMMIVLTRLLEPAEFGLFAFALLVVNFFDYVKDLGFGASVVQSRRPWAEIAPTGLLVTSLTGVAAAGILLVAAPALADVAARPELASPVRGLAVALVISALGVLPQSALRRRLDFRGRLIPEAGGAAVKTATAIVLAFAGQGVWSLVCAQILGVFVTTVLYWRAGGAGLRFGFDRRVFGELLRFGLPVSMVTIVAYGIYNVDYLAIGARLGDGTLGLYTLAYRVPELLVLNLCIVVSDVLFSALSRLQDDSEALVRHYRDAVAWVIAVAAPVGLGLMVVADPLIRTLYGDRYAEAAPMLALISLFAVAYATSFHTGDVFKAIGRPGILTALNAGKLVVMVGPVWWAAGHGAVAVAAVLVAVELVSSGLRLWVLTRVTASPMGTLLGSILRPLVAAAVMAGVVWLTSLLTAGLHPAVALSILVPVGLSVYPIALRVTAPVLFSTGVGLVGRARAARLCRKSADLTGSMR